MNRLQPVNKNFVPDTQSAHSKIDEKLWNFGNWLSEEDEFSDTIISSRIRLARNLKGHRFPNQATSNELKYVVRNVREACTKSKNLTSASFVEMAGLSEWDRKYYVERRLASPQLIQKKFPSLLVIAADETLSIMVNEEDHLRIQCIVAGLKIDDAWKKISRIDDELEENLNFSYSKKYGYLTACPTNLGTGMRVSVFVHLPALALQSKVDNLIRNLPVSEIAVRGFYGEGTESIGNIYQISNQLTLGRTESNVIERIYATAQKMVESERQARNKLFAKERIKLEDSVFRALGILQNARLMSSLEAMNLLSTLRLGKELGILTGISRLSINQLMVLVQPAHLQKIYEQTLTEEERDIIRSEFIREILPAV